MSMDRDELINAAAKNKIPQIIVGYLKLQQAKKNDFFDLLLQKKINGRLFYNTCLPDGTKEIKYGNEDFLNDEFKKAVDDLLLPFQSLSLEQVKAESAQPSELTDKMHDVIATFMQSIETCQEWKKFWEMEIQLQTEKEHKKELYNLIAGAAAYKALVSCIDHSTSISNPLVKRNIAALIGMCTNKYESSALKDAPAFALKHSIEFQIKRKEHDAMGDFTVFKKQKTTAAPVKKKRKKKNPALEIKPAQIK